MKNNSTLKIGIIGGAGYTAGELIRILLNHPNAEITFIHSTTQAGQPITTVHKDLFGDTDLMFTDKVIPVDVLYLCLGHGLSEEFLKNNKISPKTKIIDLGNDFRINTQLTLPYENTPREFIYGLPECNREAIKKAQNIANPGCFATAIQLALLPLAQQKTLNNEIHIHAITGSTGAGRSLTETGQFSYRNNNVSIYKAFTHQHLGEIKKTLNTFNPSLSDINFIPVRGNFTRGIFASIYTNCALSKQELNNLYSAYYANHPFTHVAQGEISLKEVVNTNKCILSVEKYGDKVLITSIIDNLVKGASGQAVQNMNLLFGLDERTGLNLKPSAF